MKLPTTDDPVRIIHADAWDVLERIPDGGVDHVISDPPYSAKTHKGARTNRSETGVGEFINFDSIDGPTFVKLCGELCRVAKRWVILTCDWHHAFLIEEAMPDEFVRLGVFVKPNGMPQITGDRPATGWEAVLILHRKGKKRWNNGGHHAVWTYNKPQNPVHPTEKPLPLIRNWLRDFTDPGELVLDPFAGAATTALACLYEGRRCLSVERDEDYVEVGRKRIAKLQSSDCLLQYTPRQKPDETDLFS